MSRKPDTLWTEFAFELESFSGLISRAKTVRISNSTAKDGARNLVQTYFRTTRPHLSALQCTPQVIASLDSDMQALLSQIDANARKTSIQGILKRIKRFKSQLETERELKLGQLSGPITQTIVLTTIETSILETLRKLLPSAALSYEQAVRDLSSKDRLSFRGTANELREALRELLDHLAPDAKVSAMPGFKLENDARKPTQKQKVKFILSARGLAKNAINAPADSVLLVENMTAALARSSYERSNISAHVSSAQQEVRQMKMYVDSVLAELLEIHKRI